MKKKLVALVMSLVVLFSCCTAFAVTHYGTDSTTQNSQEEGAFFLLNNTGNVVGALRLDEFTVKIREGGSPVALNVGYQTITGILAEGKLLRCKNLKSVTMNDDKTAITTGESYVIASWQVMNQAIIDSLGIDSLAQLAENTKFALDIGGKDFAGHRFLDTDAGTEVARINVGKTYLSIRYADWEDGITGNLVLCFRAGAQAYSGGTNNTTPTVTATPNPTQQPTVQPTQQPTAKPTQQPTAKPTQQPVVTPQPQQPANTPNPQFQPVVTPPTLSGTNNSSGSGSSSGSSSSNSGNSGNVPNPEFQNGSNLPGNLGDFWN